jgi:erythronate-4-phosphate dehydrogenase
LREDVILVNTSRGKVVDEHALFKKLTIHSNMSVILDVWKNEPRINLFLLQETALGTPHIAGYSFDGKVRGTEMLYQAVCSYFNYSPTWQMHTCLPEPPLLRLTFSQTVEDRVAIRTAVLACYDVRRDDATLRLISQSPHPYLYFDELRKNYPMRREFNSVTIELPPEKTILSNQLKSLGFKVVTPR